VNQPTNQPHIPNVPPNMRAVISTLTPHAAKLLAAEILLADPKSLGDDVLESCLYILRERLTGAAADGDDAPDGTAAATT
jgi:hypothetical protein